uniref:Essential for reactive oxygen species protein n=1 Tax=Periophthalmus magnuspinnatus TaxID=409849 RepID=A0A3B4BJ44_9GOBI
MGYMTVEEHSPTLLHLKRAPGIRSWSLLVGISSIGLAAAYYSSDSILWKLFYISGCLFVAMQNMEEWEERVWPHNGSRPQRITMVKCNSVVSE